MKSINGRQSLLRADHRYTFSEYFKLNFPTDEIVAEFGYDFQIEPLTLPRTSRNVQSITKRLEEMLMQTLPKISLNSELAKRDFMIAPVLQEVVRHVNVKLRVEYPLNIDDRLNGNLDYLIRSQQNLIVLEAKKSDLENGFNQLAVELIALDCHETATSPAIIYGVISTGDVWRFGWLLRDKKQITKDFHGYRVPEDLADIFSILIGILE